MSGIAGTYINATNTDDATALTFALQNDGSFSGIADDLLGGYGTFTGSLTAKEPSDDDYAAATAILSCSSYSGPSISGVSDCASYAYFPANIQLSELPEVMNDNLAMYASAGGLEGNILGFPALFNSASGQIFICVSTSTAKPTQVITDPFDSSLTSQSDGDNYIDSDSGTGSAGDGYTTNSTFQPIETILPSTNCKGRLFFNSDGSEIYIFDYRSGGPATLLVVNTTSNTVIDTIELNMVVQQIVEQSSNSTIITAITTELGVDVEENDTTRYYLTFIDTESRTTQDVYIGEASEIRYDGVTISNDSIFLYLYQQDPQSSDDYIEYLDTKLLFRVDMNAQKVEPLGTLSTTEAVIGDTENGSGILLLKDIQRHTDISGNERTGSLIVADYDDPTNENLWRTIKENFVFSYLTWSEVDRSLFSYTLEESDSDNESDNLDENGRKQFTQVVRQYDTDSGDIVATLTLPVLVSIYQDFVFSDDSSMLIISDTFADPSTVTIIDLDSMEYIGSYEFYDVFSPLTISPTNRLLYMQGHDSCLSVIDLETGSNIATMDVVLHNSAGYISTAAIAPDASFGYFTAVDDTDVRLFRFETNEKISAIDAASQWAKRNVTPAHLVIGGIVLAAAAGGGVIAIVAHRRKKAAAAARNGNVPNRNDDFPNGGGSLPNMPAR